MKKFQQFVDKITPSYRTIEAIKGGLGVLGVLAVGVGIVYLIGSEALKGHSRATENLRLFSASNHLISGTCNQWDTNNDGKISCTASDKFGALIQLECEANWANEGTGSCKVSFGKLQGYNNRNSN